MNSSSYTMYQWQLNINEAWNIFIIIELTDNTAAGK